jgi:DNA-directed RNA polymerase subunit M/transcription elongation factor TFIIS
MLKTEIKFCPNCKNDLTNNKKLAQNVKECNHCGTRFFILITSNFEIKNND